MNYEELQAEVEQVESLIIQGSELTLAETKAKKLIESLPSEKSRDVAELYCRILISLSESLWQRGITIEGIKFADQALAVAEQLESKELQAKAYGNCGNVYSYHWDNAKALMYFKKALAFSEEIGSKYDVARNLGNIGIVYSNITDLSQALEYMKKALPLFVELDNKVAIANNLCNTGIVYNQLSDYVQALENMEKSLSIFQELGRKEGMASNYGNIGNVYRLLADYNQALDYHHRAHILYEELGRKDGIARMLCCTGDVYIYLMDYQQALTNYLKSLAIYEEIGRKDGIANNLCTCGLAYQNLEDYNSALMYYQKSLEIYEELGSKEGITRSLASIGSTYAETKFDGYNLVKAEEYLKKAIVLLSEIGVKQLLYEVHKNLADLYKKEKRWEEFAIHFEMYHDIEKEVLNEEAKKQGQLMEHRRKIEESERDRQVKLARFQEQEKILHNILPSQIAERMVSGEKTIADTHENVSVFFSDIVGFTKLSQQVPAVELVGMLNGIFTQFDQIARKHGLEKIKTIGDAYMAVCGAPIPMENHAERAALFALEVSELMNEYRTNSGERVELRIGLHSGNVVAGIIGENKFAYDMWGDAVNTASRMESHGETGKIHVSEDFMRSVEAYTSLGNVNFTTRGEMDIKGKGIMKTYFLEYLK